jgi:ribosomal protein S18 acetylase RimI-like enzyme
MTDDARQAYREVRPTEDGVGPDYVESTFPKAEYKMFEVLKPKFLKEENGIRFHVGFSKMELFATVGDRTTLRAVGFLSVEIDRSDGELVLSNLAVSPDYRRMGVATTMLALLEAANPSARMDRALGPVSGEGAATVNAYNQRRRGGP